MDDKKICFIMCVTSQRLMEEAVYYINRLNVPEGYSVELLTVTDAGSMAAGYNEAMNASDAKYKVYMHQDVFIIERDFIFHILNIFENPDIGMLGVFGFKKLVENCIMWKGVPEYAVGELYSNVIHKTACYMWNNDEAYQEVEVLDGLLMVTQYDIPWREDIFDKWDFYDASQSMEFKKAGYKVVVPQIKRPWCIHDDGILNMRNYHGERKKYIKEYREK